MMNYDQRTVFERWMTLANRYAQEGNYDWAKESYKDAFDLAIACNDNASERAKIGMINCLKHLQKGADLSDNR